MSKITRIRERDGSEKPFEEERIVRSVYRAAQETGQADLVVARELAGVVTLFLERRHWETVPHVEDIQDMVERVLLETGHVEVARAYIRARQTRVPAPAPPRTASLFPEKTLFVTAPSGTGLFPWDRDRIERALQREASLPADLAAGVAETVEKKILAKGLDRISSRLIRSLVDAELFARGLSDRIPAQGVVGVPGYDLKRWIEAAEAPGEVTRRVAERALTQFTLAEVLPPEVSEAHAEGRIHVVGVEYPLHLHAAFFTLEFVKCFGSAPGDPKESVIPEDPGSLSEALRKASQDLARYVHGFVDVGYLNLMAAPLLGEEDPYAVAAPLLGALEVSGREIPPLETSAQIHGGVPDFLRFTDAAGPGGIRLGRGYGEFWTDAERLTRAMMDALHRPGGPGAPEVFYHVDANTFRNPSSLSLTRAFCAEIARGLPLTFVFERKGSELRVHSRFLTRVEDPAFFRQPESTRIPYVQMVALNAAQAAYRAGRGNVDAFTDELESGLRLAFEAHVRKRSFLDRVWGEFEGPLAGLRRDAPDGRPVLDLSRGEYLVTVSGFPEAVAYLSGAEHVLEGEAVKIAAQMASFLSLKVNEEARRTGIRASLAGPCPRAATDRFSEADAALFPQAMERLGVQAYRAGLVLQEEMPHDLLQAVRIVGSLYSLLEPCVTLAGIGEIVEKEPDALFDLVCEVFERTEMTYLVFEEHDAQP